MPRVLFKNTFRFCQSGGEIRLFEQGKTYELDLHILDRLQFLKCDCEVVYEKMNNPITENKMIDPVAENKSVTGKKSNKRKAKVEAEVKVEEQ